MDGQCTMEEAADDVRKSSRHYAKRQLTWLRRNEKMHWLTRREGEPGDEILQRARQIIRNFDN